MAQTRTKGKSSSSSRGRGGTSAGQSGTGGASGKTPQAGRPSGGASAAYGGAKPPVRREIAAGICFILGIFAFIGYFDDKAVFISFFSGFVKRLIGHGYFVLPPALIMCSVILAFHKGYPVLLRAISALSLTVLLGALVHLFVTPNDKYELSLAMLGNLWNDGAELNSGGLISGSLSEIFTTLFGNVGAAITLLIIGTILVMIAFNATLSGILAAFSSREKREYRPEFESDTHSDEAEYADYEQMEERRRAYRYPLIPLWKKKKIDIPLDEKKRSKKDYFPGEPMDALYDQTPGVKTPDEIIRQTPPWESALRESDLSPNENESDEQGVRDGKSRQDDMPLDIPSSWFSKDKNRPSVIIPPIIEENFINTAPVGLGEDTKEPEAAPLAAENIESVRENKGEKTKKRALPVVPMPEGADTPDVTIYAFPPLNLLSRGDPSSRAGDSEVKLNTERLEAAFQSFGIELDIINATRGPSVTRYEAKLEAGIKLSRLTGLSDDIALALGTLGVRIAAIPNKVSTIGIEVPNKVVSKVHLRDVLETKEFENSASALSFAIGMDISGEPIIGEISKLPHMLIAGTTGSGKSVCLNSIILSILYKATPEDARFIMIDPKMVEFKVYDGIPHLLVPLVTDVKKAAGALQWATVQMMKRYSLFSETSARDIGGYNALAREPGSETEHLPQIIIIIDELADLMMMAAKDVEESVCRIAQMGRAAGIHLVIATQSPRANVITGLMKANIPSRIAFKVASALESQIILDPGQNADKLVGNGDMLYAPTGAAKPMRLQGTWVTDKEREKVVDYIKGGNEPQYSEEAIHGIDKAVSDKASGDKSGGEMGQDNDYDEFLPQAVNVFLETGQGSVSLLQRRLKLGYARAARIVDQMEELGVVGPFEGSKPREILVTRDQWRQMQYVSGVAPGDKARSDEDDDEDVIATLSDDM
ncbi:MAG: DNA translocase FtsK [Oscillospiraceae bacterium]|nr:DNA translocase FtsK [Oscillospiraceae bacterium]